jgi:myo-inositol 2-dehydrogenase / D-chiro-inositol 1-dehydrogenase
VRVRLGIIGLGVMGADHARTLSGPLAGAAELTGLYDIDPARVEVALGNGAKRYQDAAELIGSPDVDAVIIASADATHEEYVLACLDAGKPVLCEKPLAPTAEACHRIVAAQELARARAGRDLVSVGFMRRYDPGFRRLKRADLGATLLLHCQHRNAASEAGWPTESLIVSSAVHEFDTIRWLTGDEIVSVTVHVPRSTSYASGGTRDPLLLVVRTAAGVVADIEIFVNARYGYDVRCERVAERGVTDLGIPAETRFADWRDRFADAYRAELTDWLEGVRAGEVRGATAYDGLAAQRVCDAAIEALHTGTTVSLTEVD